MGATGRHAVKAYLPRSRVRLCNNTISEEHAEYSVRSYILVYYNMLTYRMFIIRPPSTARFLPHPCGHCDVQVRQRRATHWTSSNGSRRAKARVPRVARVKSTDLSLARVTLIDDRAWLGLLGQNAAQPWLLRGLPPRSMRKLCRHLATII